MTDRELAERAVELLIGFRDALNQGIHKIEKELRVPDEDPPDKKDEEK